MLCVVVVGFIPGINCIPLLQRQLWLQMKRNAEESLQFLIKLINVYKALLCPLWLSDKHKWKIEIIKNI